MPFYGATRRVLLGTSEAVLILPKVGPFAASGSVPVSSLSDQIYSTTTPRPISSRTSPLKFNTITVNSNSTLRASTTGTTRYGIFFWANKIILNGSVNMSGEPGADGDPFSGGGGGGGYGGSGGGGGAGDVNDFSIFPGGNGGAGDAGADGQGDSFGSGGGGFATTYNSGFTYGSGGAGGNSSDGLATGGVSGNGWGGGGGGGFVDSTTGSRYAGAGGGGGGLICVVTNWLTRTTTAGQFLVTGGDGGLSDGSGFAGDGGAGGGGVIYVAAKRYDGNLTSPAYAGGAPSAGNGSYQLLEITSAGALVAHTLWTDTWNNL